MVTIKLILIIKIILNYCLIWINYNIYFINKKGPKKKLSKMEKAKIEAEHAETMRIEMEKER